MREVKFRGQAKYDGQWVYGYYVKRNGYDYGIIYEPNGLGHDVYPETVGIYTGLKDKNGKEIFNSDFLKDTQGNIYLVVWREDLASFGIEKNGWMFTHFFGEGIEASEVEVIGNIYENPELLSNKEDLENGQKH